MKEELKEYLDKGLEVSKKLFKKGAETSKVYLDKAGKAAQKFGDESVLKIEIKQLESQIKKDKTELGEIAYKNFVEDDKAELARDNQEVKFLLEKISQGYEEIKNREQKLEEIEKQQ